MAKQLNCWVDESIADRVEAAARADDRSVSSWLRRLVLAALDGAQDATEPDEVAA